MTTSLNPAPVMVGLRREPPLEMELGHVIDAGAVDDLRAHLRRITIAPHRLNLTCGTVQAIDPVGAALLWLLCTDLERTVGTHVTLIHLPTPVAQKLRSHPLLSYVAYGDELFQDPFHSPLPSNR
jgi:hypothetical protein